MADPQLLKQISIKTGALRRIMKELACYKKEVEKETAKLESMKAEPNADEHLIKKQGEVLEESLAMIPNSCRRMQNALDELKKLIGDNASVLDGTKEYMAAWEQIEAANAVE